MKLTVAQRHVLERLLKRSNNPGTTLGFDRRGKNATESHWLPQWQTLWRLEEGGLIEDCQWDAAQFRITPAGRAALEEA